MENQKTKTLRQILLIAGFLFCAQLVANAQAHLQVTIQDGEATTQCIDFFNPADPRFQVRINNGPRTTYPAEGNCFQDFPFMQYEAYYNCPNNVPNTINLCFRVLEDDGSPCDVDATCTVEVCADYNIPAPGTSVDYSVDIANGQLSDGFLDFTIELSDNFQGGLNDLVCDAIELGELPYSGTLGNPALSNYNNYCSSNTGDASPTAFGVDRGVWFTFTTGTDVSAYNYINGFSDPQNLGDEIGLQIGLFQSGDGTCNDIFHVYSDHDYAELDQTLLAPCLEPNTRYYILVDPAYLPNTNVGLEGVFGLQLAAFGIEATADFRCDAEDLGTVPTGGMLATPMNQTNICGTDIGENDASAFQLQRAVWFMFQAPESGHVDINVISDQAFPNGVDQIGAQLALYRSVTGSCLGPMAEITSSYTSADLNESVSARCLVPGENYWFLIDGSGNNTVGVFSVEVIDAGPVPPQFITLVNEVLCADNPGLLVGDSLYNQSGPIEEIVLAANGCDSLITGSLVVLAPIETTIDTTICFGESVTIGNSIYFETGGYSDSFNSYQSCDSTVITNVTVLENIEAVAFQVQEASDQNASDGSATVTVTSGTGPFSYNWSNGETTQTINNLSPGLYCVTVSADNSCDEVTCISVLYPGAISVDVQDGSVTCNGDTDGTISVVISDGSPPYSYQWGTDFGAAQGNGMILNAGQSAFINNLPPGDNYTITVTDNDGLIVVSFGEIVEPLPIVNNLDTTLCFGESLLVGTSTYNSSGPIQENLSSVDGCDSLVTGTLTILDEVSTTLNLTECFGSVVTVGNTNYSATGPINEVLTAYSGCDSTISGFLTILPEIATTIDTTVCAGESVQIGLSTYNTTGSFVDTLPAFNGCDSLVTTNLTVYEPLTLTTSLTSEASGYGDADGVATVTPSGGSGTYTYLWEDGATTATATGLTGGQTYCVTVTDAIGCSEEACQIIYFPVNILSDSENDTLDCPGDANGSLIFTGYNGQAPYTYTWSNDSGTLSGSGTIDSENGASAINNLPAGSYTIEISDIWGSGSFTWMVIEPTPMVVDVVEQLDASCFGDCNGVLEVSVTNGAAPYNFVWSDGTIGNRLENLCAGGYELLIIDANGCTTTWQGAVAEPDEFVADAVELDPISCNGGADGAAGIVTNGTPVSVLWSTGDTTLELNNLVADVYTVTVTNADNCQATASLDITEPLSAIESEISINQEISCNGADDAALTISATGGNGFSFTWSDGETGAIRSDLGAGTYAVTILDENGCDAFNEITLEEPTPINATLSAIDVNCFEGDDSGIILIDTVSGGVGDYVASLDGETFYTIDRFENLVAGNYDLYVQDANGCTESFSASVASPGEIMVDLGDDLMIHLGESVTLEALTSSQNPLFKWSVDSLTCIYCPTITLSPFNANAYSVTVTDEISGCSATDNIIVNVSKERIVFLPNIFTPNGDGQNDIFNVFAGPSVAKINNFRVFNRWGETVYAAEDFLPGTNFGWDGLLKGDRAPNGVYVYFLDVEFIDGRMERFEGDVTLMK